MDNQKQIYREEAHELLAELETSLLELEENPEDRELVGRVFRAMHTIKGSGAMFGFDDIAAFTHEVETVFDRVRSGEIPVTQALVNAALCARDQILIMLDEETGGEPVDPARSREIIDAFKALHSEVQKTSEAGAEAVTETQETGDGSGKEVTYRIRFRPDTDIFSNGTNPILLLAELQELGEMDLVAQTDAIPMLDDFNPEACYVYWDILLTTHKGINAIRDVFIFVEDESELTIKTIDEDDLSDKDPAYKRLGEILVDRGDVSTDDLNRVLDTHKPKRIGDVLVESAVVDRSAVESALTEQGHVRKKRQMRQETVKSSSMRVDAQRLDNLVDLVGELVTVQARLTQKSASGADPELLSIAEEVERLTGELRDNTMSIRMLQLGTTFAKFRRLVRDLSNELGKEIVMTTAGGETELDKTVIEQLNDPLVHIIRNSIDHGIEPPDDREAAGKSRQGTVNLSAEHSGANVLIRIHDDGRGLDADAIRERAVERGLIPADAVPEGPELYSLIFEPGFSTAKAVTGVSGRGVGMDVVKSGIEALRGSVEVDSQQGSGTTITLKLPLTLAIIDGLMVKVGDGFFIIPLSVVEECVEFSRREVEIAQERSMMNIRGKVVPYLGLREMFLVEGEPPEIEQIVVAEAMGDRVGFGVDTVIGQHQTVIKTLSKVYKHVEGISGATILGDGTVALILDVHMLVKTVKKGAAGNRRQHQPVAASV